MWGGIIPPLSWIVLAPFDYPFLSTVFYLICFYYMTFMKRRDAVSLLFFLSPILVYHFGIVAAT